MRLYSSVWSGLESAVAVGKDPPASQLPIFTGQETDEIRRSQEGAQVDALKLSPDTDLVSTVKKVLGETPRFRRSSVVSLGRAPVPLQSPQHGPRPQAFGKYDSHEF